MSIVKKIRSWKKMLFVGICLALVGGFFAFAGTVAVQANWLQKGDFCFNGSCLSRWDAWLNPVDMSDADTDGVFNFQDMCPRAKGLEACKDKPTITSVCHDGCPDTDSDGFFDNGEDECPGTPAPRTAGVQEKGCPPPQGMRFSFDDYGKGINTKEIYEGDTVNLFWNSDLSHIALSDRSKYSISITQNPSDGANLQDFDRHMFNGSAKNITVVKSTHFTLIITGPGIHPRSTDIVAIVKVVHGVWSAPTPCSARCGMGWQRKFCNNPAPSGGGRWCELDSGARGIEWKEGNRYAVEEIRCETPIKCFKEDRGVGCLDDPQYESIQHCPNGSKEKCDGKDEGYTCNYDEPGLCGILGKHSTAVIRCVYNEKYAEQQTSGSIEHNAVPVRRGNCTEVTLYRDNQTGDYVTPDKCRRWEKVEQEEEVTEEVPDCGGQEARFKTCDGRYTNYPSDSDCNRKEGNYTRNCCQYEYGYFVGNEKVSSRDDYRCPRVRKSRKVPKGGEKLVDHCGSQKTVYVHWTTGKQYNSERECNDN